LNLLFFSIVYIMYLLHSTQRCVYNIRVFIYLFDSDHKRPYAVTHIKHIQEVQVQ